MESRVRIEAPAKINLHLSVFPRREDGYHDILSIFQAVSLCDSLEARRLPEGGSGCAITGVAGVASRDNVIYRAWEAFRSRFEIEGGVEVAVRKCIPMGGGLGGGSSDAAAALRAFRLLFDAPADDGMLASLGAGIGSDVPFFCGSTVAVVCGRGERVLPLPPRRDYGILLALPDFPVATADAYRWMDEADAVDRAPGPLSEADLAAMYAGRPADWRFENAFARVLEPRYPLYGHVRARMSAAGSLFWGISGSGSACFGVFDSLDAAKAAENEIRDLPISFRSVSPLARIAAGIVQ